MGIKKKHTGKKGGRKIGRDKAKCQRYKLEGIREKNKARHIAKQKRFEAKKKLKRSKQFKMWVVN